MSVYVRQCLSHNSDIYVCWLSMNGTFKCKHYHLILQRCPVAYGSQYDILLFSRWSQLTGFAFSILYNCCGVAWTSEFFSREYGTQPTSETTTIAFYFSMESWIQCNSSYHLNALSRYLGKKQRAISLYWALFCCVIMCPLPKCKSLPVEETEKKNGEK